MEVFRCSGSKHRPTFEVNIITLKVENETRTEVISLRLNKTVASKMTILCVL